MSVSQRSICPPLKTDFKICINDRLLKCLAWEQFRIWESFERGKLRVGLREVTEEHTHIQNTGWGEEKKNRKDLCY